MTSRADVNRLSAAQRELVRLAQADLAGFFRTVDLTRPERVRDALLEIVPLLVREYGELAATVAAEWYESVHPGAYLARTASGVAEAQVQGSVRYAAGQLFTDDPMKTATILAGAVQRFVTYSGRQTVARNVQRDPSRPRFGRVPSGAKTCAWCSLMASRGFVYHSEASAGDLFGRGIGDDFHDDCDCQVVAEWDAEAHHIEGYDPDRLYDMYMAARMKAGDVSDETAILSNMREMFPDEFKDGHVH